MANPILPQILVPGKKVTPSAYKSDSSNFKYRRGVEEYVVTEFDPYSEEFKASLELGKIKEVSTNDVGIPFFLESSAPKSTILKTAFKKIQSSDFKVKPIYKQYNAFTRGRGIDGEYFSTVNFNHPDLTKVSSFILFLKTILLDNFLGEEFIPSNGANSLFDSSRNKIFMGLRSTDASFHGGFFRRLINIFEAVNGSIFCLSYIGFTGNSPSTAMLYHVWLNRTAYEKGIDPGEMIPIYASDGMAHTLASIFWRYLDMRISPEGEVFLKLKSPEEGLLIEIPLSQELLADCSVGRFGENYYGTRFYYATNHMTVPGARGLAEVGCRVSERGSISKVDNISSKSLIIQDLAEVLIGSGLKNPNQSIADYRNAFRIKLKDTLSYRPKHKELIEEAKEKIFSAKLRKETQGRVIVDKPVLHHADFGNRFSKPPLIKPLVFSP